MKVIGKDEKNIHKVSCENCASIVEYILYETTQKTKRYHDGSSDIIDVLCCPTCGEDIVLC